MLQSMTLSASSSLCSHGALTATAPAVQARLGGLEQGGAVGPAAERADGSARRSVGVAQRGARVAAGAHAVPEQQRDQPPDGACVAGVPGAAVPARRAAHGVADPPAHRDAVRPPAAGPRGAAAAPRRHAQHQPGPEAAWARAERRRGQLGRRGRGPRWRAQRRGFPQRHESAGRRREPLRH